MHFMNSGPVFESKPGWGGKLNMWMRTYLLYIIPAIIIVVLVILAITGESESTSPTASATPMASATATPSQSSNTVIKGDSYTSIARRIVTSLITSETTKGARLYAETTLVQTIKNQPLIVGQSVSYDESAVRTYLTTDYANLFPSQRTKWEAMASKVKF